MGEGGRGDGHNEGGAPEGGQGTEHVICMGDGGHIYTILHHPSRTCDPSMEE